MAYTQVQAEQYRVSNYAPELPTNLSSIVDQRTFRKDDDFQTVTVDPIKRDAWVRGVGYLDPMDTVRRSHAQDVAQVNHLLSKIGQTAPDMPTYVPSTSVFDGLPKFASSGYQCWRGMDKDMSDAGMLPVIEQLKYDYRLRGTPDDVITDQIYDRAKTVEARIHSRGGWGERRPDDPKFLNF